MTKSVINISGILSIVFLLLSCNVEGELSDVGFGYLDLRVSKDLNLDVVPVVKSQSEEDVIELTLTPETGEPVVIPDVNSLTEPLRLKTGRYKAVATSGVDGGSAAFDSPFYYGEKQIEIRNMQNTVEEIVCTLTSVKVTASFSDLFKASFDYVLTVSNGENSLVFSQEEGTLDKAGYFYVTDNLSWRLDLVNAKGESFTVEDSYEDIAARQHYDLKFDIEESSDEAIGASEFVITVNDSLNQKEYDMPIYIFDIRILGNNTVSYYSGEAQTGSLYEVSSNKAYTTVSITHTNSVLASCGLPQSVELVDAEEELITSLAESGINISFADPYGVETTLLTDQTTNVNIDFSDFFTDLPIGNYTIDVAAKEITDQPASMTINISVKSPVEITSVVTWAKFAVVKGKYYTNSLPSGFAVKYKYSTASDWSTAAPLIQDVNTSAKTFKMMICKLSENTNYSFAPYTTKDGVLASKSSWTEAAPTIPNLNFDTWTTQSGVVYPYTGKNNGVWDTANEGLNVLSPNNITTEEKSSVVKGSAARMLSKEVTIFTVSKFAAGNIYTGDFDAITTSPMGAKLYWGIKFAGRPVALKGYYKYTPVTISHADAAHSSFKGQTDKCQIQVALTTATSGSGTYYFYVNTGANQFVEFSSSNTSMIAHNKFESSETVTNYKQFSLLFGYRNINVKPTYGIVTCCASYMGDYFTGGNGSLMYADEFELIYDPSDASLSDQQRREFFNLF